MTGQKSDTANDKINSKRSSCSSANGKIPLMAKKIAIKGQIVLVVSIGPF